MKASKQDRSLIKLMWDYIEVTADMNLSLTLGFPSTFIDSTLVFGRKITAG